MDRTTMRARRVANVIAMLAILVLLIWFWRARILKPNARPTFPGIDTFLYYVPMYAGIAGAFREGRVPLWNPYQGCGEPFLGVLQSAVFYPTRLLLLVLDPAQAFGVSTLLHLALGALAMFALCRALGSGIAGALAASAALTYGFGVTAIYAPTTFLEPGVWWPIAALALLRTVTTGRWRFVALLTWAMAAPILAGGYQIAVYSTYGLALFGLGLVLDRRWRAAVLVPATLARIGLAGVLAVALSSVQWGPTALWAHDAVRTAHALPPQQIDPWAAAPRTVAEGLLARRAVLTAILLPPPLVVLALLGLVRGPRVVLPLGLGGIVALLLSLGPQTPWFGLYYWLPGFAMFRIPSRLHYFVVLAAAVASAFGLEALVRRARPAGAWRTLVALAVVMTGLVVMLHAPVPEHGPKALSVGLAMPHVDGYDLVAAATTLASVLLPPPLVAPGALVPVLLTAIGNRANDSLMPYAGGDTLLTRHHETYRRIAGVAGLWRSTFLSSDPLSVPMASKQAMLVGLYAPDDYDPLVSGRLSSYLALLAQGTEPPEGRWPRGAHLDLTAPPAHRTLLDMMSVRYLVVGVPLLRGKGARALFGPYPPLGGLVAWGDSRALEIRENPAALPRAYTVGAVRRVLTEEEARNAIIDPTFDPRHEVVTTARDSTPTSGDTGLVPAEIVSYQPERVIVRVRRAGEGVLVLTDAYAEGWKATVDGRPVPVWPANYLFRAVAVPAGEHEVVFHYDAPGYRAGRAVALAAIAVLALGPLASAWARRYGR